MNADLKVGATKVTERTWNVYENKGASLKTRQRSRNVYENTGT